MIYNHEVWTQASSGDFTWNLKHNILLEIAPTKYVAPKYDKSNHWNERNTSKFSHWVPVPPRHIILGQKLHHPISAKRTWCCCYWLRWTPHGSAQLPLLAQKAEGWTTIRSPASTGPSISGIAAGWPWRSMNTKITQRSRKKKLHISQVRYYMEVSINRGTPVAGW